VNAPLPALSLRTHDGKGSRTSAIGLISGLHHAIVWSADPVSLILTFVSDRAGSSSGTTCRHGFINRTRLEKAFLRTSELPSCRDEKTAETGEEQLIEHRAITADGRQLWFQTALRLGEKSERLARAKFAVFLSTSPDQGRGARSCRKPSCARRISLSRVSRAQDSTHLSEAPAPGNAPSGA